LYCLPNLRHREQRHIVISPQLGHMNLVASVPGEIILWQDVHVGIVIVTAVFSLMLLWASMYVLA
jgi:hypothetical protein